MEAGRGVVSEQQAVVACRGGRLWRLVVEAGRAGWIEDMASRGGSFMAGQENG